MGEEKKYEKLDEYIEKQLKELYGAKERLTSQLNFIVGRITEVESLRDGGWKEVVTPPPTPKKEKPVKPVEPEPAKEVGKE